MTTPAYFHQECPTCSRGLRVRLAYLGRQVVCQHCGGRFEACDPSSQPEQSSQLSGLALMQKADELLESVNLPPQEIA